jgi:hypothetical protein
MLTEHVIFVERQIPWAATGLLLAQRSLADSDSAVYGKGCPGPVPYEARRSLGQLPERGRELCEVLALYRLRFTIVRGMPMQSRLKGRTLSLA